MRNYLFIILSVLLFGGCGQKPAELDTSIVTTNDLLPSTKECADVNFHKNVLSYKNSINLFKCLGWDSEFKVIYNSIIELGEQNYNLILGPANEMFFGNEAKRYKFLSFLNKNIRKDNIDRLEPVIKAFVEEYEVLDALIETLKITSKQNKRINIFPTQNVFNILLASLSEITKDVESARFNLANKYEVSKRELPEKFEENFINTIIQTITSALESQGEDLSSVGRFLQDGKWTHFMFQTISKNTYDELVYYPLVDSDIMNQARIVKEIITENKYNCSDTNGVYYLDQSKEINFRIEKLRNSNREEFAKSLFDLQLRYSLFNNICPYPELNYVVPSLLNHLSSYVLLDGGFDIFKSIAKTDEKDNLLLFDFVSSEFFETFFSLLELDKTNQKFLGETFYFFKEFSIRNFLALQNSLFAVSSDKELLDSWQPVWKDLRMESRHKLIKFYINLFLLPEDISESIVVINRLNKEFNSLFTIYSENFNDNQSEYHYVFEFMKNKLKVSDTRDELTKFLSGDRALKLITLLSSTNIESSSSIEEQEVQKLEEDRYAQNYVASESLICLRSFHQLILEDYNFRTILDQYPKECIKLKRESKTIAHKIYEWTFDIDNIYTSKFNKRFSVPYGMISGEMMNFYHSVLQMINDYVDTSDGYIKRIINSIDKHLYKLGLIEVLNSSLQLVANLSDDTEIVTKSMDKLTTLEPEEFNDGFKSLLQLASVHLDENESDEPINFDCNKVSPHAGGKRCLDKNEVLSLVIDLKDLLIRKNNSTNTMLSELVSFIHPAKTIKIPFDRKKQKEYNLSLDELVNFAFDATSNETDKRVHIFSESSSKIINLNLIERLEVVIREISFLNNFYGAFFINKVARAKKYTKNIKSMKKNVYLMDSSSSTFRRLGIFPDSTRWAFKNIINTYDSLWEVNNHFKQVDNTSKQYGDLIQGILTVAVKSSSLRSQKFLPFKKPDAQQVEGHNGKFITKVADHNLLGQLGILLRSNFESKEELLKDKRFMTINKNFLKQIDTKSLEKTLNVFLRHKNFNLIVKDIIDFLANSKENEKNLNNLYDVLYYISKYITKNELNDLDVVLTSLLDSYIDIKTHINSSHITNLLDKGLNIFDQVPDESQKLIIEIIVSLIQDVDKEVADNLFTLKNLELVSNILNSMSQYLDYNTSSTGVMRSMLNDSRLDFTQIQKTFNTVKEKDGDYRYLINIVKLMAEKDQSNKSNIQKGINEVILEHEDVVESFLLDLFDRFNSTYSN